MGKQIKHGIVETVNRFDEIALRYDDMRKIPNADIYWSDKDSTVIVITTQDWKDYLMNRVKENKLWQ